MVLRFNILVFSIILFVGCTKDKSETDFPISKVQNFDLENNNADFLINVSKLQNGQYQIEYRDTLTAKLDSTLHSKILDLQNKNRQRHEYAKIKLELDKNILYSEFKNLTKEFRKIFYQSFVLRINENQYLRIQLLPEYQKANKYYDSRIIGQGPPHTLYEELKPYFMENKILYVTVENGVLKLNDNRGNEVSNYKNYALENKRFITLYEVKDDQTYQDFVTLYSQLIQWHNELKTSIDNENNGIEKKDEYKFMIVEKTHHNNV